VAWLGVTCHTLSPHTSHRCHTCAQVLARGEGVRCKSARLGVTHSTRHAHDVTLMWSLRTQECCKWVGWVEVMSHSSVWVQPTHSKCGAMRASWVHTNLTCQVSVNSTQAHQHTPTPCLKRFTNFEKLAHEKFWNAQARHAVSVALSLWVVLFLLTHMSHNKTYWHKTKFVNNMSSITCYLTSFFFVLSGFLCAWVPVRTDESKRMKSFRWVRTQRTPTRRLCGHNTLRTVWNTNMGVYLRSEAVSVDSLSCIKQELRLIGLFKPLEA
jgi:hypothetical protein